ncbi:tetratricopeptide repeat protein [Shewanella litoralis]|uniref:MSHA biogenesis protein MshN n=1 Tax=Shewanella litoralis TaxID=2282700 RepID=A0ABQ2R9C5_9GAMM|nr:tetratricopeptide repeat protein [Shewanella litoralis]GGQ15169.1 MSHA biogenesis protein MshN [Shewanella litoralis]
MSVIIKMLRDLEQREKPDPTQSAPTPSQAKGEFVRPQVQYYPAEKSRSPLIAAGVCLLLLIPAVWFGMSMYQQADSSVAQQLAEVSPTRLNNADDKAADASVKPTNEPQPDVAGLAQTNSGAAASASVVNHLDNAGKIVSDTALTESESEAVELVSKSVATIPDTSVTLVSTEPARLTQADEPVISTSDLTSTNKQKEVKEAQAVVVKNSPSEVTSSDKPVVAKANISANKATVDSNAALNDMTVKEVVLTKTQMAQLQYRKAVDAEKAQNVDDAASFYLEAIILQPNLHKARKQLVAIYYAQNNTTTAMRLLESGLSMFPQEWEFYVILARIQAEVKAFDSANSTLAAIPDNSSWARDKWVAQTELAQNTQNFVLAEQAYRQLLQAESTQARWWMGLGYALDSQQKYVPAAQAYRSALSYEGLSTSAMNFIETRLAQLGENR